jgi:hypothetical protein
MNRASRGTSGDAREGIKMELLLALIGWALIVTAGYFIGKNKGREVAGVILAALLGLIGLVIVACLPRSRATKMAVEAQEQRQYDIQQAQAAGYPPPPAYFYPPQPAPGGPGPDQSEPPPRQW